MKNYKKEKGFSILAMVITLAFLLTLVSFATLRGSDSTNTITNNTISNTLISQASIIRSRILACSIEYSTGNNGTGFRTQYPAGSTPTSVNTLTCPGAANANIWTLLDGISTPQAVSGFGNWQYINDATNMRLTLLANPDRINLLPLVVTGLGANQTSITGGNTLQWIIVQ